MYFVLQCETRNSLCEVYLVEVLNLKPIKAVQVFINAHKNSKTTCTSIEFLKTFVN